MAWNEGADIQTYQEKGLNTLGGLQRRTRRQTLEYQKSNLLAQLDVTEKALAALDAHPELEEFIETLARAGA